MEESVDGTAATNIVSGSSSEDNEEDEKDIEVPYNQSIMEDNEAKEVIYKRKNKKKTGNTVFGPDAKT